jgi:hypothetical protein
MKLEHSATRALGVTIALCLFTVGCAKRDDDAPPSQSTPDVAVAPAQVSPDAFNALRWLEGRWVGSGVTQPPFYEEYKFFDDSTAVSRSFADSTFRQINDSSVIQLRSGKLESVSSSSRYVAVAIGSDSVVFSGARSGFLWQRRSPTEWTAVILPAPGSQRAPVTYQMRKLP